MEKSILNVLKPAAEVLNGLTEEQASRVMSRAVDFMAGAAFRERLEAAKQEQAVSA